MRKKKRRGRGDRSNSSLGDMLGKTGQVYCNRSSEFRAVFVAGVNYAQEILLGQGRIDRKPEFEL